MVSGMPTGGFPSPDEEGERQDWRLFRVLVAIIVVGTAAMAAAFLLT